MYKIFILPLFLCLLSGNSHAADFISLCESCEIQSHYEGRALNEVSAIGQPGAYDVLVINTRNHDAYHVHIEYTPPGYPPLGTINPGESFSPSDYEIDPSANGRESLITSKRASEDELTEINAILDFFKNGIVIILPNIPDYYGSFIGRNHEALSLYIFNQMTQRNPAWAASYLRQATRHLLRRKLKDTFGRDIQACVVFNNGDSACFTPNLSTPSISTYVQGTAKDVNGNPISDGYGGGGGGLEHRYNGGSSARYGLPREGWWRPVEYWLVCVIMNGKIQNCRLQVAP